MTTKQTPSSSQSNQGSEDKQDQSLYYTQVNMIEGRDISELRIIKRDGFFGVTLPVCVRIPDTTAQTAANFTAPFFIAPRAYEVIEVTERHETAGSDAGAVTLMLKKVPSGTAPGSGSDILSAGINLKATANTNQTLGAKTTPNILQTLDGSAVPYRRLSDGDALALVTTGTLTALKGVTVSVLLKAI